MAQRNKTKRTGKASPAIPADLEALILLDAEAIHFDELELHLQGLELDIEPPKGTKADAPDAAKASKGTGHHPPVKVLPRPAGALRRLDRRRSSEFCPNFRAATR